MEKIYEVNFISSENGMYNLEYYNDLDKLIEEINNEKETEFDLFNTEFNELLEYFKDDTLIELKVLSDDERMKHLKEMFYYASDENVHYVTHESLEDFVKYRTEVFYSLTEDTTLELYMYSLDREREHVKEVYNLITGEYPFVIEERTGFNEHEDILNLIELNDDLRISEVVRFIKNK